MREMIVPLCIALYICSGSLLYAHESRIDEKKADLIVYRPKNDTIEIHYGDFANFDVAIAMHPGEHLLERSYICVSEKASGGEEQCTNQNAFDWSGFLSGTHLVAVSLKSYPDLERYEANRYFLTAESSVMIDTVDSAKIVAHIQHSRLAELILQRDATLSRFNHMFFYNNNTRAVIVENAQQTEYILKYKVIGAPVEVVSHESNERDESPSNSGHQHQQQRHVILFMTDTSHLLPSNRFRDWLCDHAAFADRGYTLSVLTGGDGSSDDTIDSVCGVPVVRFACLSLTHAAQYNSEEPEHIFTSDDDSIAVLRSYLQSSSIDVVIATNTFGDPQTSLLLNVISSMRTVTTKQRTAPLVLMDLPNLLVPHAWCETIDGYIAPSRATGLHPATIDQGE